jgi:hypothetical protein
MYYVANARLERARDLKRAESASLDYHEFARRAMSVRTHGAQLGL